MMNNVCRFLMSSLLGSSPEITSQVLNCDSGSCLLIHGKTTTLRLKRSMRELELGLPKAKFLRNGNHPDSHFGSMGNVESLLPLIALSLRLMTPITAGSGKSVLRFVGPTIFSFGAV